MPRFDPQPGDQFQIDSSTYEVMRHPAVPYMAYAQEGRKATVYQLRAENQLYALKVFKRPYQRDSLVDTCQSLSELSWIEGLTVCDRLCLTHELTSDLVQQYSDIEFSVLMPWITGYTWFDIVFGRVSITLDVSLQLARHISTSLAQLEANGLAHSDIAGGNVIVDLETGRVSIIDVEDMYGAGFVMDGAFPKGTTGYQHKSIDQIQCGQWCTEGDRFSGAVLLAEILTWHHPDIRYHASEEHYFDQDELQAPESPNYKRIMEVLYHYAPQIIDCFEQAWHSTSLADCPPLQMWMERLHSSADIQPKGEFRERTRLYAPEWLPVGECDWHANEFKKTGKVEVQLLWQRANFKHSYEVLYTNHENSETTYYASHRMHSFQLPVGKHGFRVRVVNSNGLKSPWSHDLYIHVHKNRWWPAKPKVFIHTSDQASDNVGLQHPLEVRTLNRGSNIFTSKSLHIPKILLTEELLIAKTEYKIQWSSVRGANMYLLQMAENEPTDQHDPFITVYQGPQTTFTSCHDHLHTYYYRVCALWNNLYASNWSEVATMQITPIAEYDGKTNIITEIAIPKWMTVEHIEWNAKHFGRTGKVEINLLWRRTDFKHNYELSHTDGLNIERIQPSNHCAASFSLSLGQHQFRVRVVDSNGFKSCWSTNLVVDIKRSAWRFFQQPQVRIVQEEVSPLYM